MSDVEAGRIDVIVVYKVDRLTRSLADFAKLVELFDGRGVSFVSVTQQFNTTTSMGRLTLNVLLSFAQFEREVTSERIRDKIAASKRKGLWVGGIAPLGYETKDRKIIVVEEQAERVRTIFRRYLELGSLNHLMADLRERGIVTKVRSLKTLDKSGNSYLPAFGTGACLLSKNLFLANLPKKEKQPYTDLPRLPRFLVSDFSRALPVSDLAFFAPAPELDFLKASFPFLRCAGVNHKTG